MHIEEGADLKVKPGYTLTRSKNARSAYEDGKYVTDAVASAMKKGIFSGPFS